MPEFRQEGDEYLYVWHDNSVGVKFSQLRRLDSSQAIRGFVDVYSIRPDSPVPGSQWWNRIDLTTQTDRTRTIDFLKKLTGMEQVKGAWDYEVNWIYQDCARRFLVPPAAVDLAEVEADDDDDLDPQYLFNPIALLNQVNMFLADQGSTKSYLLLYLAVCIVTGRASIFGTPRVRGPVVFFDWEVDRGATRRRLRLICRGLGLVEIPRGIYYVNMSDAGSIMDCIRDMRQQVSRVSAVATIIDSLTFGAGGDLNSPEIGGPTAKALGSLGKGVTKLITAHPPKSSRRPGNGGVDDVSVIGSGLFEFRARSIYYMKAPPRHVRGEMFTVTMQDRKLNEAGSNGEVFYEITFDNLEHKVLLRRSTAAEKAEQANGQLVGEDAMLAMLGSGPANTAQIARALKVDSNEVRAWGSRLFKSDRVIKLGGDSDGRTTVWSLKPGVVVEELPF